MSASTRQGATEAKATPPQSVPAPASPYDELRDSSSPLAQRSVYFDLDASLVKPEYRTLVEAHARYLRAHRGTKVRIEGNTDERGTREYNLALGNQRADAVRKLLLLLGAVEQQAESVSFGKEKPRAAGHDEEAWSVNRRADIVYVRPN
jgi:peptidoglycan-associated lipoprotein